MAWQFLGEASGNEVGQLRFSFWLALCVASSLLLLYVIGFAVHSDEGGTWVGAAVSALFGAVAGWLGNDGKYPVLDSLILAGVFVAAFLRQLRSSRRDESGE